MKSIPSVTPCLLGKRGLTIHARYVPLAPNGKAIVGTYERVPGTALAGTVTVADNGAIEPDYDGTTEMDWDAQTTVRKGGRRLWVDEDGHLWSEAKLCFRATS